MASTFSGTFDQLQGIVRDLGIEGEWSDRPNEAKCFRSHDGGLVTWYPSTRNLQFQGNQKAREELQRRVLEAIEQPIPAREVAPGRPTPAADLRVFVVHGHDQAAREQLELVLHKLGLDPFVLANTGGGGLTIIEALEAEI